MPKILVADDNANIQKMVSLSFEDRGIQVVTVGNGEAAVRRIPDVQPDLVLADIFMPVRNGYEVCEFVKKDERFSHVPVILLVGAFDPLDEKEARRVGADGVLKKPFVPPDPLIAMVMSALEKNPKVAAELARAKEAKEAPPPPVESIPEPPTSVRSELKPLPEFPEPASVEEQALAYGFGTGRRALEAAREPEETKEEPKPAVASSDKSEEDEFDTSSTTRDWRRNAMEIDIPAEAANRPAFVTDDESDSGMFPSERDVPPRRVSIPEPEPAEEAQLFAQTPEPVRAPLVETETALPAPIVQADSDFFAPAEPAIEQSAVISEPVPMLEAGEIDEKTPQPGPSHWMDQLAQGSSEHPATDWMSALSEQTAKVSSEVSVPVVTESVESRGTFLPEGPESQAEAPAEISAWMSTSKESNATSEQQPSGEDFFADEPAPSTRGDSWLSSAASAEPPAEPMHEFLGEQVIETTSSESVPVTASGVDEGFEKDTEVAAPLSFKDPDLVEPSPAVHVTPEPLLIDDEPQASSEYGFDPKEDLQPLHSFRMPAAVDPVAHRTPNGGYPLGALEPPVAFEAPVAFEPPVPEIDERIPTGPPPNREALAEIPFLTPPPDFHEHATEHAASDPETVDAVVRKVLEKLEPQLHDLLSQGVLKPLVENLLQNELAKKEK